jgi:hypothetical protein
VDEQHFANGGARPLMSHRQSDASRRKKADGVVGVDSVRSGTYGLMANYREF